MSNQLTTDGTHQTKENGNFKAGITPAPYPNPSEATIAARNRKVLPTAGEQPKEKRGNNGTCQRQMPELRANADCHFFQIFSRKAFALPETARIVIALRDTHAAANSFWGYQPRTV